MSDDKKVCWKPNDHHPRCRCYVGMHVLYRGSAEAKRLDAEAASLNEDAK